MTDNPEYAATYVKNGGQVVKVTIPRATFIQMQSEMLVFPSSGLHGISYGAEFLITPTVAPEFVKLFQPY